ncbi:hypothetical protein [Nocardia sp. NPDC050412]
MSGVDLYRLNYVAIMLDWAPIVICDDVSIGPEFRLLTTVHPMADQRR